MTRLLNLCFSSLNVNLTKLLSKLCGLKNSPSGYALLCMIFITVSLGPIAWYQKFEYAISHWLQKSTEHVSACVLCSPGCFSLFRAKAILDDNVLMKYAKLPDRAMDHIQFDQGKVIISNITSFQNLLAFYY